MDYLPLLGLAIPPILFTWALIEYLLDTRRR